MTGSTLACVCRMNLTKTLLPVACGLVALTLSASASVVPFLTLTEVSSTQLNWSWPSGGSGTFTAVSSDVWQSTTLLGPVLSGFDSLHFGWIEPDNSLQINNVSLSTSGNGTYTLNVTSDATGVDVTRVTDGTERFSGNNGFGVIYNDVGGSTLLLLSLAGGALICFRHRRVLGPR